MFTDSFTKAKKYISRGDNTKLSALLAQKPSLTSTVSKGCTLLHHAAQTSYTEIVLTLLLRGAEIDKKDSLNRTAIEISLELKLEDVCVLLIQNGADLTVKNLKGQSLLHLSAIYGCSKVLCALLGKAMDVNEKDDDGNTAIILAIKKGQPSNVSVALTLIDKGADLSIPDKNGKLPLELAGQKGFMGLEAAIKYHLENIVVIRDSPPPPEEPQQEAEQSPVVPLHSKSLNDINQRSQATNHIKPHEHDKESVPPSDEASKIIAKANSDIPPESHPPVLSTHTTMAAIESRSSPNTGTQSTTVASPAAVDAIAESAPLLLEQSTVHEPLHGGHTSATVMPVHRNSAEKEKEKPKQHVSFAGEVSAVFPEVNDDSLPKTEASSAHSHPSVDVSSAPKKSKKKAKESAELIQEIKELKASDSSGVDLGVPVTPLPTPAPVPVPQDTHVISAPPPLVEDEFMSLENSRPAKSLSSQPKKQQQHTSADDDSKAKKSKNAVKKSKSRSDAVAAESDTVEKSKAGLSSAVTYIYDSDTLEEPKKPLICGFIDSEAINCVIC